MSKLCYKSRISLIAILPASMACLAMDLKAQDSSPPVKVPARLASWEVTVQNDPGGRAYQHPIAVRTDGRHKYESTDNRGKKVFYQGTLSGQDAATVYAAAREAINHITFVDFVTGHETYDAGMYDVRLSSGSRAIRVTLDHEMPARLGFDASLTDGFRLLNKAIRRHVAWQSAQFQEPQRRDAQRSSQLAPDRRMTVPDVAPDWINVSLKIESPRQKIQMIVFNPDDNPDDRYHRRYRWSRDDMEVVTWPQDAARPPRRQALGISADDRAAVFRSIRVILNQFTLTDDADDDSRGEVRCFIKIYGWLRSMEVEFSFSEALPEEWRSRISEILDFAHGKFAEFPIMDELSAED